MCIEKRPSLENRSFTPSKLLMFIEHDAGIDDGLKAEGIQSELAKLYEKAELFFGGDSELSINELNMERVTTLEWFGDSAITIVPVEVRLTTPNAPEDNPYECIYVEFPDHTETINAETRTWVNDRVIIDLVMRLNQVIADYGEWETYVPDEGGGGVKYERKQGGNPRVTTRKRPPLRERESFMARAAMPDWYNSAAQGERIGTGGPGGRPVPIAASVKNNEKLQMSAITAVATQVAAAHGASARGTYVSHCPVDIVILDTAPRRDQIRNAYAKHQTNTTMRTLFDPNNSLLRISYYADFANASVMGITDLMEFMSKEVVIDKHEYDVSDHGTFIASLIYELIEQAQAGLQQSIDYRMHLIQVLSDKGTGTTQSIFNGLVHAIANRRQGAALVMNCSFMLVTPQEVDLQYVNPVNPATIAQFNSQVLDVSRDMITVLLDGLWQVSQASIVAASGNEGKKLDAATGAMVNEKARMPASLQGVTGVASLKAKQSTVLADYSNKPDNPEVDGFAVFGGSLMPKTGFTNAKKGIYGLYTAETFEARPGQAKRPENHSGWAAWSGTSFAAPFVTAAFAVSRAMDCRATANDVSNALRNVAVDVKDGGHVLPTVDTP